MTLSTETLEPVGSCMRIHSLCTDTPKPVHKYACT
uniref:Uncharacterized protein n=1 Tax=Arundo donax TaxID=35708 RepID=A0A0A9C5G0_ARUDO